MVRFADFQLDRSSNDLVDILQQLPAHVLSEGLKRGTLAIGGLVVDHQHRLSGIRVRIWITKGSFGSHGSSHRQAIQRNTVPASTLNMPREDRLITD